MSWKPIVVGVDGSPEAANAAVFAVAAAQRAATTFHLVHAVPTAEHGRYPFTEHDKQIRRQLVATLGNRVPVALSGLAIHAGRPAAVLNGAVAAHGAELIVLGGKHHSALGRWLGGSTSLNVTRSAVVPLLVTVGEPTIRRVLVAVDQSHAARATLGAAERYAKLFGAELRAVTVIEPLPVVPQVPQPDEADYNGLLEETVARDIWSLVRTPGVDTQIRQGAALETILREAAEWRADLLVVGSHGKGFVKRMVLGSVTEGLINHLPTSLLVVPAAAAAVEPAARAS